MRPQHPTRKGTDPMKHRITSIVLGGLLALGMFTTSTDPATAAEGTVRCAALGICPTAPAERPVPRRQQDSTTFDRRYVDREWKSTVLAPTTGFVRHLVRRGDTLSSISRRYYGTSSRWPELARVNSIPNPHRIRVGLNVFVPIP